jgi:hypothetical protein
MATRGRPRINAEPMTSADRRKRWDERMRNVEGKEAGQPRRTPVLVYLCDEAREVLRQERALAKSAELPAVRDSELVEGLLRRHAIDTDRTDRPGLSIEHLRRHFDLKEGAVQAARADLARQAVNPVKRNKRTALRIADLPRSAPTSQELAQELVRRNNTVNEAFFTKLSTDLRPLFMHPLQPAELNVKLRRYIEAHIERLLVAAR